MVNFEDIEITSIERTCIACPASWYGRTGNGGEWYVRFRGGRFSFRYSDTEVGEDKDYLPGEYEVYSDEDYDSLDGHMDAYELRDKLRSIGVNFDSVLPDEFYDGLSPENCECHLVGDWFSKAECNSCEFSISKDEVETLQYETYIPKECPVCASSIEVVTEKPERVENWGRE